MADAELLDWLVARQEAMVALLRRFVEIESPSTEKDAVDRMGAALAEALEETGARVERIPVVDRGDHVRAELAGSGSGRILILGHMDTVWEIGTLRTMPFRVEAGRAYGPGSFDMKAGLVQLVFALRALRALGRAPARDVVALVTSDEEIGSASSRRLIEELARGSDVALVLEPSLPPDGRVKTFRKGVGVFSVEVHGRAAHAGLDPRSGVSAIEEMARQILILHGMTDHERGITVNVGTVRGGTRVNVVAAEARAEVDLRVATMRDAAAMEAAIRGLRPVLEGARVTVRGGIDRPPLERTPAVVALYETARRLAAGLGFELGEGPAGGGSDGNLTAAVGVPTLDGLGAVGDGAHAPGEHVVVAEMPRRAALVARLVETLGEDAGA